MAFQSKKEIIKVSVLFLVVLGAAFCINYLRNSAAARLDFLDNYTIPTEFIFNNQKIVLAWTDDNTGENLIIQSDKKEYSGFNQADVYFSITNISRQSQKVDLKFIPAKGDYIEVAALEQINKIDEAWNINSEQTNFYKATLKFKPHSKGEFFIEAKGDKGGYGFLDPWYSSSWTYKRAITLQGSKIATTTANFPILATTTLADLKTTTNGGKVGNDSGYDIIFVDSDDSTLLNYEREKYASTTGEIAYWIKTDIASSTDKTIYMYYGNAGASDTATTTGVWDSNFVGVWHLPDQTTASGTDSTLFANNGKVMNGASTTASAQIDGGMQFDGVDDYVAGTTLTGFTAGNRITVAAWIKPSAVDSTQNIALNGNEDYKFRIEVVPTTNTARIGVGNGVEWTIPVNFREGTTVLSANTWYYILGLWDGTNIKLFVNGIQENTNLAWAGNTATAAGAIIGAYTTVNTTYSFPGLIDEVRISNTARTAGWITTEWNNQSNAGTFMTIGAEETAPSGETPGKFRFNGGMFKIKGKAIFK